MTITAKQGWVNPDTFRTTLTAIYADGSIRQVTQDGPINDEDFVTNDSLDTIIDIPRFLLNYKDRTPEEQLQNFLLLHNVANHLIRKGIPVEIMYRPVQDFPSGPKEAKSRALPLDYKQLEEAFDSLLGKRIYLYQVMGTEAMNHLGMKLVGYKMRYDEEDLV